MILAAVAEVYERYGFEALDTGAFEYADALGKFLPDADRPNEGVFALTDDDEQWMALRYDLTAPLARFAAQNWATLPKPFRRYAFGPVWRNEKPGPGRYREFVQCDADTVGSARPEADAEIIAIGQAPAEIDAQAAQRTFPGDRPSAFILIDRLTPERLGALLAPYEHKTFVEGVLWGINSFDQWGVELGKSLAARVLGELEGGPASAHDPSTANLIAKLKDRS